jgi:hypothetical protein
MSDRIWLFLPNFLKKSVGQGFSLALYNIIQSIAHALDEVLDFGKLLKPRSMANRLGDFTEYYASDDRKLDLARIGASRFLFKRYSETWDDFEYRLQQFPNDVLDFGTAQGLIRELERTGLSVELLEELFNDKYRWIILSAADQCLEPEDQISHMFADGDEDPYVRGTRMYSADDSELFCFDLYLTGSTLYAKSEIQEIVKFVKPAYTKCYCFFPNQEFAEVII